MINSKGGSFKVLRVLSDSSKDKTRGGHGAVRLCLVKGSVLRSVACLPTHPVLAIAPSQRIYIIHRDPRIYPVPSIAPSQRIYIIHRDSRIYMGIYMCGDIYGSMYAWRRE
jgi:hypothetical protein